MISRRRPPRPARRFSPPSPASLSRVRWRVKPRPHSFPRSISRGTGSRQRVSPNNGQLRAQRPPGETAQAYTFDSATVVPFRLELRSRSLGQDSALLRVRRRHRAGQPRRLRKHPPWAQGRTSPRTTSPSAPPTRKSMCRCARSSPFQDNLNLTNSRFQGGISTQLDVDQAEATLAAAQAPACHAALAALAARARSRRVDRACRRRDSRSPTIRSTSNRRAFPPAYPRPA